ncbi:hypothetical protein [Buttiauxella warmboldiae]|uniref:hypothetical protein n=1 Tax=Buttiauxella warmboldiae TaxID=82993 RepID=UPI00142D25B2|nr:hypothetical protein [Buttiauxella warmboldiae]
MTTLNQAPTPKTEGLQEEEPQPEAKSGTVQVPESWQLTAQQKDFIELFSTDDDIKK